MELRSQNPQKDTFRTRAQYTMYTNFRLHYHNFEERYMYYLQQGGSEKKHTLDSNQTRVDVELKTHHTKFCNPIAQRGVKL